LLLLAIDPFFDMGRTVINVLGNCIATASVSKWEGQSDVLVIPPAQPMESLNGGRAESSYNL
jgi:Na+/H+-dicarboxylate symporter